MTRGDSCGLGGLDGDDGGVESARSATASVDAPVSLLVVAIISFLRDELAVMVPEVA